MKGEVKGKIITESFGLKSKMCSLIVVSSEEIKKAKGVNKNVVENTEHKKYVNVLFDKYFIRHKMKRIQSRLQRIET